MRNPKVLFHWPCMGPYHFARMNALARFGGVALHVVESTSLDDHHWLRRERPQDYSVITLSAEMLSPRTLAAAAPQLQAELDRFRPDVLVACGYAGLTPWQSYRRFRAAGGKVVFWSESTALDHPRRWWREKAKSWLARRFAGAIVPGQRPRRYLESLGVPIDHICVAGGVVDNDFFRAGAAACRSEKGIIRRRLGLPDRYFLYVGRLIPEKNLLGLLAAYAKYRETTSPTTGWGLVLVGGGTEEPVLRKTAAERNLPDLCFAGVRQIDELPAYYALAGCLVLPSRSEPWGLVVNEAMACALPVLVSNQCGCVEDLVVAGENGLTFEAADTDSLTRLLAAIAGGKVDLAAMGRRSESIIQQFSPQAYGERLGRFFASLCAPRE